MSGSVAKSQVSQRSYASSLQQDAILDVPEPYASSCSVVSSFVQEKVQDDNLLLSAFDPEQIISDLEEDEANLRFKMGHSSNPFEWKGVEVANIYSLEDRTDVPFDFQNPTLHYPQ